MEKDEPLFRYQTPGVPRGNDAEFFAEDGIIEIEDLQEELFTILRLADGTRTKDEIIELAQEQELDAEFTEAVIDDLEKLEILGDSREIYKWFHDYTNSPSKFNRFVNTEDIREITSRPYVAEKTGDRIDLPRPTSDLAEILRKRESVRNFEDRPIELGKLAEVLDSAYSLETKPVPSAGGLYPIKLYMAVQEGHEIPAGLYQYDPNEGGVIKFDEYPHRKTMEFIFNSDSLVHGAPVHLVIAADMDRHPEKYSNRGYRYSILEAGHVAQNVHLACVEQGLGSLEYGGFDDDKVHETFQLDENIRPLITLALGYKNESEDRFDSVQTFAKLDMELVGEDKPVDSVSINAFSAIADDLPFYHAVAHYKSPNESYRQDKDEKFTSGNGTSMHLAQVKAIAEAYERYESGRIKYDLKSSASALEQRYLDPRVLLPLGKEQMEHSKLAEFSDGIELEWVRALDAKTGEAVFVPIDMVYYPVSEQELGRKPIAAADSSGVAAHTDKNIAVEKGLLELIERDAIMRNWFKREPLPKLSEELLDDYVVGRIEYWRQKGFLIDVLDMTPENSAAAIINVTVRNSAKSYPYFVNGAAAARNYDEAIGKALEEAELGLAYAVHNPVEEKVQMEHIHSPSEHGIFYLHPENAHNIEWLWQGEMVHRYRELDDVSDLISQYSPVVVELTSQDAPLHVVRVMEPRLVPISFGYGNEYYLHANSGVDSRTYSPTAPHYFA